MHVAGETDLERDPSIVDVLSQIRILYEPRSVADSVCAAHVHGLPHRLGSITFTGVNRDREIVLARVPERLNVACRRISLLPSGQIERHHAVVLEVDGEPGHLERALGRQLAQSADDEKRRDVEVLLGATKPAQGRLDRLHQCESLNDVQERSISHLDVAHTVFDGILGQLVGDALERILALPDGDRHIEAPQVIVEALGVIHPHEFLQLLGRVPRQLDPLLPRQLQKRFRPERTVQMAMQLRLGELAEFVRENRKWHYNGLKSGSSPAVCRVRTMRKIAPLCTGVLLAVTIPRLSVIIRSPLRTATACVSSQASTASRAVAAASTSTGRALM